MKYMFYDDEIANSDQYICSLSYVCTDENDIETGDFERELIDPRDTFGFFEKSKHGITEDDVFGKPTFDEFCRMTDFLDLLENCVFVAHNAQGADLHHIKKSLERYGIQLPEIHYLDTMKMAEAVLGRRQPSLLDVCDYYDVDSGLHHSAEDDARACRDVFWRLLSDLGTAEPQKWEPGANGSGSHGPKRHRPVGTLGLVNGSTKTIEEVLEEFESEGLVCDIDNLEFESGMPVVFSGVACGMTKSGIESLLVENGLKPAKNVSKKTRFLAIGDNVGQSKLNDAKEKSVPVLALADLIEILDSGL